MYNDAINSDTKKRCLVLPFSQGYGRRKGIRSDTEAGRGTFAVTYQWVRGRRLSLFAVPTMLHDQSDQKLG